MAEYKSMFRAGTPARAKAGSKARGGKPMAESMTRKSTPSAMAPAAAVSRGGGKKPAAKKATPASAAKATRARGAGLAQVKRTGTGSTMQVQDVQNTITATSAAAPKRRLQVGGLIGRTGGKWHLGRKPGKG